MTVPAPGARIAAGRVLDGRFRLEEKLGEGGFGVVFRAQQISTGQSVAIKIMHRDRAQGKRAEQAYARFEREMEVIGRLQHPNVVRLIDTGRLDDGTLYLALEYVEGVDLGTLIAREGPLSEREAIRLMGQVLEALDVAHTAGVVHRDLKPDNIMITRAGARRSALVLDFGIAGLTPPPSSDPAEIERLTATGQFLGTPAYMAPEQFTGDPPAPSIDIYAWGLVFIEVLTGEHPVDAASVNAIILAHMSGDPVPLPDAIETPGLRDLLARATAKDVEARYPDAASTLSDLERTGSGARPRGQPSGRVSADSDALAATLPPTAVSAHAPTADETSPAVDGGGDIDEDADPADDTSTPDAAGGTRLLKAGVAALGVSVVVGLVLLLVLASDSSDDAATDDRTGATGTPSETQPGDGDTDTTSAPAVGAPATDVTPPSQERGLQAGALYRPPGTRGPSLVYEPGGSFPHGLDADWVRGALTALCSRVRGGGGSRACRTGIATSLRGPSDAVVEPFFIDRREVTHGDYAKCAAAGVCGEIDFRECALLNREGEFARPALSAKEAERVRSLLSSDTLPAVCISGAEADRYCNWAEKRLPTTSEWLFAATDGGRALFPSGGNAPDPHVNGADETLRTTMGWKGEPPILTRTGTPDEHGLMAPAQRRGQRKRTGLVDMSGNVREWVAPAGDSLALPRAARGGGWADAGPFLSPWVRNSLRPDTRRSDLGFRCARSVTESDSKLEPLTELE